MTIDEILKDISCDIDQVVVQDVWKPLCEGRSDKKKDELWSWTGDIARKMREIVRVNHKQELEQTIREAIERAKPTAWSSGDEEYNEDLDQYEANLLKELGLDDPSSKGAE